MNSLRDRLRSLEDNINSVLLGKPEVVRLAVVALLAEGHILIEDVPGVGKTLLAKALARSIDGVFHRIQFTPDLLPSDVIGTSVFHPSTNEFVFKPGPIFAHIVLADEINRATPRTQSALLEAMSDRQVSVDGITYPLEPPFLVVATQNPYEYQGTYPLPENQLDRFALRLRVGYPDRQVERQVLAQHRLGEPVEALQPVLKRDEILAMQAEVRQVRLDETLYDYLLDLVSATRQREDVQLGVSIRGALTLYRCAQALAYCENRDFVVPDDIKRLAIPVLAHRIFPLGYRYNGQVQNSEQIIAEILEQTPVPV
ncbi:ATPase RavA [bacterium HR36]|nr:ATPase RavA [bacterium HR36]